MVRAARNILNQPAFDVFNAGELSPGPSVETDQEILDWVAKDAETALHPSCTARMGVDDDSVLDPETMRVHGVAGLRVVDASSMPYVTNGNIYAPVMMLAEKSADLILGNTPLPPSNAPFYRYRDEQPAAPGLPEPIPRRKQPHDRHSRAVPPLRAPRTSGHARRSPSRTSGRSSAPRPTRSSARRTQTCRAPSCRRRPAASRR